MDQCLGFQYTLHTSFHVTKSEAHHRTLLSGPTIFTSTKLHFQKPVKRGEHLDSWKIVLLIHITQEAAEALLNWTTCMIFIRWPRLQELAVAVQLQGVAPSPGRTAWATDGVVEFVALAKPTTLAPGWRQPTHLSVLVDGLGDPLSVGVPPDGLMEWINQDHFKKLVSGIFTHPIRIQDSQSPTVTASTFLEEKINTTGCKTMYAERLLTQT